MYFTSAVSENVELKLADYKSASLAMRPYLDAYAMSEVVISSQKSVFQKVERIPGKLYFIKEGSLNCIRDSKLLFVLEEGDVIGLEGSCSDTATDFHAEFAVVIAELNLAELLSAPEISKLWGHYHSSFVCTVFAGLSEGHKADSLFSPEIRNFYPGDIIVEQGEYSLEIFSLIDGIAESVIDGKVVGEIGQETLFGAVSVLTNRERFATVRAKTECMAVVLSKEQFLALISSKPDTLLKLTEDLSKTIVALNDQVSADQRSPG